MLVIFFLIVVVVVALIVFDGLSEGELKQVVFVEVKTNAGSLSSRERQIRDVIKTKAVDWTQIKRKLELTPEFEPVEVC